MRQLEQRELRDGRIVGPVRNGARRTVTVNVGESPLNWLRARGFLDARQSEAGERLRADYETAQLSPQVTMNWDGARVRGAHTQAAIDPTLAQIAAKRRFDAALAALGGGLGDIAWRVLCACEGLAVAERTLGWPVRSGRIVLALALDRLASHYRLP